MREALFHDYVVLHLSQLKTSVALTRWRSKVRSTNKLRQGLTLQDLHLEITDVSRDMHPHLDLAAARGLRIDQPQSAAAMSSSSSRTGSSGMLSGIAKWFNWDDQLGVEVRQAVSEAGSGGIFHF